ncbi:hypothetical protein vseg_018805 [Gypsophila vaccaria]
MAKLCSMLLFITLLLVLHISISYGRPLEYSKGILKTIKANDEIIDCVDIYKQPAFAHPLLVNHTIQLKPSFDASRLGPQGVKVAVQQLWHEYGQCPQGSIPIVRKRATSAHFQNKKYAPLFRAQGVGIRQAHQYATVTSKKEGGILGIHASITNYKPYVNPAGSSFSQLWMVAGPDSDLNTVEVGWRVYPGSGTNEPTLFIYWTSDSYQHTGCYNLECPGFVQTNPSIALNGVLTHISEYDGVQYDTVYDIRKDQSTKNWWLTINGLDIGYWPTNIFNRLIDSADIVSWGGEVIEGVAPDDHTPTQMGSGHFSKESYIKASYVRDPKYLDSSGNAVTLAPGDLNSVITEGNCYDLNIEVRDVVFVFYGGPGCQK